MTARVLSLLLAVFSIAQGGINACVDETSLGGNLYLVNSTFQLARDYVPPDLVRPAVKTMGGSVQMRREAAAALEAMFAQAKTDGYTLIAVSVTAAMTGNNIFPAIEQNRDRRQACWWRFPQQRASAGAGDGPWAEEQHQP